MMFAPALSRGNRVGFPVIRQCQCPMSFAAFLLDRFELGERLQIFRPSRRHLRPDQLRQAQTQTRSAKHAQFD